MARGRTFLLSAGEASGDLYGAALAEAIRDREPEATFVGMGGDRMCEAGVELLIDIASSSVMGLTEVVRQVPEFLRKRRRLREWIARHRPDVVVPIDFPDFHLRLAESVDRLGIPVVYFIPPKAWAWRAKRADRVARVAKTVISILPFEATFYRARGANVAYVGHPLVDLVREANPLPPLEARRRFEIPPGVPTLGLLPGSRRRELEALFPAMLDAVATLRETLPTLRVVVPLAPTVTDTMLVPVREHPIFRDAILVRGETYDAIRACDVLLAASGTVTLEAALLGVPMVVVYRMSALTFAIVRRLVRVPSSALPNLIAARHVVPELLQDRATPDRMAEVVGRLLTDPDIAKRQCEDLREVAAELGDGGAIDRAAEVVLSVASEGEVVR